MTKDDDFADPVEMEKMLYSLSGAQETALEALLCGQTITRAAEAAGVARQTVSGWLNHDFTFIAAYNRRRALLSDEITNRLRALAVKAFDAIEQELEGERRLDAAKTILRAVVSLTVEPGPALPAEVEAKRRSDERATMFSSMGLM